MAIAPIRPRMVLHAACTFKVPHYKCEGWPGSVSRPVWGHENRKRLPEIPQNHPPQTPPWARDRTSRPLRAMCPRILLIGASSVTWIRRDRAGGVPCKPAQGGLGMLGSRRPSWFQGDAGREPCQLPSATRAKIRDIAWGSSVPTGDGNRCAQLPTRRAIGTGSATRHGGCRVSCRPCPESAPPGRSAIQHRNTVFPGSASAGLGCCNTMHTSQASHCGNAKRFTCVSKVHWCQANPGQRTIASRALLAAWQAPCSASKHTQTLVAM